MSSGTSGSVVSVDDTGQGPGKASKTEAEGPTEPESDSGNSLKEGGTPPGPENSAPDTLGETDQRVAEGHPAAVRPSFEGQQAPFPHAMKSFPYGYQQGSPPPRSPTVASSTGYNIQGFLIQDQAAMAQQEAAAAAAAAGTVGSFARQYGSGVPPAPPLTPTHAAANIAVIGGAGNNIPASPLFAAPSPLMYAGNPLNRLDSPAISKMAESSMASPLSPLPYLTPQALPGSPAIHNYGGILQGGAGRDGQNPSMPADHVGKAWSESLLSSQQQQQQHNFQQEKGSPYLHPHNVPAQYQLGISSSDSNHSSHSFDDMLPPAAYSGRDPSQGMYPYQNRPGPPVGIGQGGASGPYPQQWGGFYTHNRGVPPGPYGLQGPWNAPGGYRDRGPYHGRPVGPGQNFYAATTPGPPIQTSSCNKGPDGANLFIFHIPNHFTNLDMYNLFCHYGNLLSVRIMVDKDTGRSRGFGFVSYDSPDAAAMAIKELNGFVIGNKRLKVQHKQIRPGEQPGGQSPQHYHHPQHYQASPSAGTRTMESSTAGTEAMDPSGQLAQWQPIPPVPPDLSPEVSSKPQSVSPFTQPEGAMAQPVVKAGEGAGIDAADGQKDDAAGRASQICGSEGLVSSNGGAEGASALSQGGMTSFPVAVAASAPGGPDSPLSHLDSIQDALPDVSK